MRRGFIFDHNRCVNCGACSAACLIENGWTIRPRNIYTFNTGASSACAFTNLSIACNHCETPVCLTGCPASALYREPGTGAVIVNDNKCIGCKYCQWNCPYDAPKYDVEKRTIGKCNLCHQRLIEEQLPACVSSCPSGALDYGELSDNSIENSFPWFPDKGLNPAIGLRTKKIYEPLKIIPENIFVPAESLPGKEEKLIPREWSLTMFSFLTSLSVSLNIKTLLSGLSTGKLLPVAIILIAGFISLLHLGRITRAWRAIVNLKSSPLSREIAIFVIYAILNCIAALSELQGFLIAASFIGLILLLAIDYVYFFSDKRSYLCLHSGQTFISALLMISFITVSVLPFLFIAMIKLLASFYKLSVNERDGINFRLRYLRIALLLISAISLTSKFSYPGAFITCLFLTGELFDRILFYIDFDPMNINKLINNQFNIETDEKN
jgi:Fe-S-cluster-containing dehydrogenase component/DMSO reductase anchor subunit